MDRRRRVSHKDREIRKSMRHSLMRNKKNGSQGERERMIEKSPSLEGTDRALKQQDPLQYIPFSITSFSTHLFLRELGNK